MQHGKYHDKELNQVDEMWLDSFEAHIDKIRKYAERDYRDAVHNTNSESAYEAASVLAALSFVDHYVFEEVTA